MRFEMAPNIFGTQFFVDAAEIKISKQSERRLRLPTHPSPQYWDEESFKGRFPRAFNSHFSQEFENFFSGLVSEVFLERVEFTFPAFRSQKLLFELAPVGGLCRIFRKWSEFRRVRDGDKTAGLPRINALTKNPEDPFGFQQLKRPGFLPNHLPLRLPMLTVSTPFQIKLGAICARLFDPNRLRVS